MKNILLYVWVALSISLSAHAARVSIEPEAYLGDWMIAGVRDYARGPATVELAPGTYDLWIGNEARVSFLVAANGDVTSLNSAAMTGVGARLVFQTAPVAVDVGDYAGHWVVSHANDFTVGNQMLSLVRGLRYIFYVGWEGRLDFDLGASGEVTVSNAAAASGGSGSLALNTTSLRVNAGAYQGLWLLSHVSDFTRGSQTLKIVPGLDYLFYVGYAGQFRFAVAADGTVTSRNAVAARGGAGEITLNTTSATIDVGLYRGNWRFAHLHDFVKGSQVLQLVTGIRYDVHVASLGAFYVDVLANGTLVSSNNAAATGGQGRLTFANAEIYVDPGTSQEWWRLYHVTDPLFGAHRLVVVPNLDYELSVESGESGLIAMDAAGEIVAAASEVGGIVFAYAEPVPEIDTDKDGVLDASDLCANTRVKPRQIARRVDDEGCTRRQRIQTLRAELRAFVLAKKAENKSLREEIKDNKGNKQVVQSLKEEIRSNKAEIKAEKDEFKEQKKKK